MVKRSWFEYIGVMISAYNRYDAPVATNYYFYRVEGSSKRSLVQRRYPGALEQPFEETILSLSSKVAGSLRRIWICRDDHSRHCYLELNGGCPPTDLRVPGEWTMYATLT